MLCYRYEALIKVRRHYTRLTGRALIRASCYNDQYEELQQLSHLRIVGCDAWHRVPLMDESPFTYLVHGFTGMRPHPRSIVEEPCGASRALTVALRGRKMRGWATYLAPDKLDIVARTTSLSPSHPRLQSGRWKIQHARRTGEKMINYHNRYQRLQDGDRE